MKRNRFLAILIAIGIASFWLVSHSRAATETPEHKIIRTDEQFEIRDYPALILAGTSMEGADMDGSFMRLFRFISGSNEGSEKIAMTTPILIDTASEKKKMSFIMPGKAVEKSVPKPSAENVALAKIEAARFAVLRFGGGLSVENEDQAIVKLQAWLEAQKLAAKGGPTFAYYDPPWTPTFMRRNEIMVRIEK